MKEIDRIREKVQPHWISMTQIQMEYEEELDLNAAPHAPHTQRFRHRKRAWTGQEESEWQPGFAPEGE